MTNLCVNASASCDQSRGDIHVQIDLPASNEILRIAGLRNDPSRYRVGIICEDISYARLRVTDNGEGIAPDVLQRIFDPFFTTKGPQHGSGLGLSVCQGIVETHDGFCLVETELAKGTCFSVFFPVIGEAQAVTPDAPVVSRAVRGSEHVMIVDDELDLTDIMTIALERLGYKVSAFNDPADALEAFQKEPAAWDIVIADLVMPKMYGLELLERVKIINPDIPTILCSGHAERDNTRLPQAVDFCLSKPVSFPELNRCMRALLTTHVPN